MDHCHLQGVHQYLMPFQMAEAGLRSLQVQIVRPAASLHPVRVPPGLRAGDPTFWLPTALTILFGSSQHTVVLPAQSASCFPALSFPFFYNTTLRHKDTGDLTRLITLLQREEKPCAVLVPFGAVLLYASTKSVPRLTVTVADIGLGTRVCFRLPR